MASLASLLRQGEFVVTAELNPPKSAAASVVRRRADLLKGVVDAVNLTDSNRANVAMSAIAAAVLVRAAASLAAGKLLNGDEVKQPPRYFIGATASPADPKDVDRTLEKVDAGAEFLQTQPVFDPAPFSQWLTEIRKRAKDVAILAGVLILRSAEQADRLAKVPGIALPDVIRKRIHDAADGEAEGIAIAIETVRALRALPGVNGVHLYAIEWPEAIPIVVRGAGLLPRPTVKEVATA